MTHETSYATLAPNTGWAARVSRRQMVRITAMSGVALVCFNAEDLTERFDQARTKVYNMRLWIGAGEHLYSKLNNPMMTMVADGFAAHGGRHDLQYGLTSREVLQLAARTGEPVRWAHLEGRPVPFHGCLENFTRALAPWGIGSRDIPMPLNLFHHTEIDTASGVIRPSALRPCAPAAVDLRAEMDLLLAVSACLDWEAPAERPPVRVELLAR